VEAHNGNIWVENNVDAGVTFHFILPIDPDIKMPHRLPEDRKLKRGLSA